MFLKILSITLEENKYIFKMQTLKFKIEHKHNDLIVEYQKQYSILLHSAFKYFQKEDKIDSLFNYEKGSSNLIQKLKSLNNINLNKNDKKYLN